MFRDLNSIWFVLVESVIKRELDQSLCLTLQPILSHSFTPVHNNLWFPESGQVAEQSCKLDIARNKPLDAIGRTGERVTLTGSTDPTFCRT